MRLILHVILVWLLLVILLSCVLLYGRALPHTNEFQALGFEVCSGQPCFKGIIPGTSTFEDTLSILHKDMKALGPVLFYTPDTIQLTVHETPGGIVNDLEFKLYGRFPLRAVIEQLGSPCAIIFPSQPSLPRLLYPFMSVDVYLNTDRITQVATVAFIDLFATNEVAHCKSTTGRPLSDWKGFAALYRYAEAINH